MPDDNAISYDLSMLCDDIHDSEAYSDLFKNINIFYSACSVRNDLKKSLRILIMLSDLDLNRNMYTNDIQKGDQGFAFLSASIILYTKAIHTKTKHRYKYSIEKFLSKEQLQLHKRIILIRDEHLAHYGPGGSEERSWITEKVILTMDGQNIRAAHAHRAMNYKGHLAEALAYILEDVIPKVEIDTQNISINIEKEISTLLSKDENFKKIINRHVIDLNKLFPEVKNLSKLNNVKFKSFSGEMKIRTSKDY